MPRHYMSATEGEPLRAAQSARYGGFGTSPSRTAMDPLRLLTFISGPPPATEPTTFRFDTEPCTVAPMSLTDPDPLLASIVNGTVDSVETSTLPDPAEATQSRRGTP